jgi:hypothetical protein
MPDWQIPMSNIPIINLRTEVEEYLRFIKSADPHEAIFDSFSRPVSISYLTWYGMPNDLLTLMLQRFIAGLEASESKRYSLKWSDA